MEAYALSARLLLASAVGNRRSSKSESLTQEDLGLDWSMTVVFWFVLTRSSYIDTNTHVGEAPSMQNSDLRCSVIVDLRFLNKVWMWRITFQLIEYNTRLRVQELLCY